MADAKHSTNNWTEELARFLREEPEVGAVRFEAGSHTLSVATLGDINLARLEEKLAATMAAIEERISTGAGLVAPAGYALKREGGTVTLARESCETVQKFWQWREMEWPEITAEPRPEDQEWRLLAKLAGACAVLGVAGVVVERAWPEWAWLAHALYIGALLAGAWDAAIDTFENLRKGKIDIHFLMLIVAVGAVSIGAWSEAVLLLFLFSASGAMEAYALDRTQREIGVLLKSAPKKATQVLADGTEREIRVEELALGQTVRVKPGEAFATDGVVVSGRSASDESTLTGEAHPVEKKTGDQVFSGTINLWGSVDFQVARLPSESTLQKIIRLIQTAQKLKAPSERFTDRFGTGYTYLVLGLSLAMFFFWWLGQGLPAFANDTGARSAFYRAMTLLVVASPCALVLSIPSAILAAIAWGARHGVLFRGGAAIEQLAEITTVALDKTGTLTTGSLEVVGYESFPPGRETEIMELAYALEAKSEHPLARAIVRDAKVRGVRLIELGDFKNIVGQGVSGKFGETQAVLGRRELLESGPLASWAGKLPDAPAELSEVWVVGKDVLGRVLLRDEIRAESKGVLAELKRLGIRTVMLTGDRRQAAEAVAREIGLDEVRAHLTPEQKVEAVMELRGASSHSRVAMVGDGVNDAPSLAAADVSVAMGARGSDAALEQAEVILMHDRIENFLAAVRLSRRAKAIIRQNLVISIGVVVVMVVATAIGVVPLALGVAAHEGSTVVVCLNSLRLLFGRND